MKSLTLVVVVREAINGEAIGAKLGLILQRKYEGREGSTK